MLGIHVMYSAWNPKDNCDVSASVFVVQFNGFMSLTLFSGHYLCYRSTLDIGVLGYIGIL